ncbi:hypothetical protein PLANPX_1708 [Lacipirellula parvula]|uniref:G domain-containing protein n=2 Tax=Lacipirellula parvula TaxID=2650471 RepID=A0A5K7XCJ0_9BACT|nr:hypothetical protein PLANPX_1708 [Lacipirellula parvula]
MDAGAIGVKVGLEVLRRTAPRGIKWLSTFYNGIELLIIGPGGAGKTSISDYLQFGELEDHRPHEKTLDVTKSSTFEIACGKNESLKLRIRRTVDVPGQTGPVEHANLVRDRRPHAILIVFDANSSVKSLQEWLDPFCERIDAIFREDSSLQRKLRGVFVALNKRDLVQSHHFSARQAKVKKCLLDGLGPIHGVQKAKAIPVVGTIAIKVDGGDARLLDTLIRTIAKQIRK